MTAPPSVGAFKIDVSPFFDALEHAARDALVDAVDRAAEVVAFDARAEHPYTDRTGQLTESIEALPAHATVMGAEGGVIASMPYASYVEARGFEFLSPAFQRSHDRIEHEMYDALERAVDRAVDRAGAR